MSVSRVDPTDAPGVLLARLFDDAALFPPARLDMAAALAGHARHHRADHAWMVGRFVCPADRLDELVTVLGDDQYVELSVVVDEPVDAARAAAAVASGRVALGTVELPPGAPLAEVVEVLPEGVRVLAEVAVTGRPSDEIAAAVATLAGVPGAAAKVRCGGDSQAAVPVPEELAGFLAACRDAGVAWKATAGLHHPLHGRRANGLVEHGFLNLAAAGGLALAGASVEAVAGVLDGTEVALDATGLRVAEVVFTAGELAILRERFLAVGSCSVDEPVADLVALGVAGMGGGGAAAGGWALG